MKRIRHILLATVFCSLVAGTVFAAPVSYTSVLNGTVESVVPVGTAVHEGDVLVTVQSLAGPMAAARARTSGIVQAVKTAPGQAVTQGAVVVVVESK